MYQIPIDESHYHANSLSPEELLWGEQTYRHVLERYQKLKDFIDQETQPLNLNESGKLKLCTTITLAFLQLASEFAVFAGFLYFITK